MNKLIDITGKKYGKITVIEYIGFTSDSRFLCKCDCGNIVEKFGRSLRNGMGLHCGCSPVLLKDLTGKRFGKLLVLERESRHRYKCQCDCGKIAYIHPHKLRKGIQESCGCLFYFHDDREAAKIRHIYIGYKKDATKRELQFSIEENVFKELILSKCYYCGIEWSNIRDDRNKKNSDFVLKYNGIDRLDNNKGYIKNNIVSCCILCNLFKRMMTIEKFIEWVSLVYHNFANNFVFPDLDINKEYNHKKHFQVDKLTNSMFRRQFSQIKFRSEKKRGLEWNIKLNLYFYLIFQGCYYCGRVGISKLKHRSKELYRHYNGIDRIDNTKYYTWDNVITCCIDCNSAKKDLTLDEFRQKIVDIYSNIMINKFIKRAVIE